MVDERVPDSVRAYDAQAAQLVAEYEALDPTAYRATYRSMLPSGSGRLALDVGAGSGRDAAWLAELGFDVVAVEPAAGMRDAGRRLHGGSTIRWVYDRLPGLNVTHTNERPKLGRHDRPIKVRDWVVAVAELPVRKRLDMHRRRGFAITRSLQCVQGSTFGNR